MKVLGIDPDTGTTAWALVSTDALHACGLVISNRGIWGHARVADQHRALIREICTAGTPLRQAIEAADKIVVEGQHFKKTGKLVSYLTVVVVEVLGCFETAEAIA